MCRPYKFGAPPSHCTIHCNCFLFVSSQLRYYFSKHLSFSSQFRSSLVVPESSFSSYIISFSTRLYLSSSSQQPLFLPFHFVFVFVFVFFAFIVNSSNLLQLSQLDSKVFARYKTIITPYQIERGPLLALYISLDALYTLNSIELPNFGVSPIQIWRFAFALYSTLQLLFICIVSATLLLLEAFIIFVSISIFVCSIRIVFFKLYNFVFNSTISIVVELAAFILAFSFRLRLRLRLLCTYRGFVESFTIVAIGPKSIREI